jgi:hypothetical protein
MIEKIIYDYLNSLEELPVKTYTEVPETRPSRFYLIEKTGETITDRIRTATIAIKAHGDSLYDAIDLNNKVITAMLDGLISLDRISGVKLNSDYNFTDTTTKTYRYQSVYVVTYY